MSRADVCRRLTEATFAPVKLRQSGDSRYDHSLRVAENVKSWGERDYMVALLHDILEDTGLPGEVIRVLFGQDVYEDVLILTHETPHLTYRDYIERICKEGSDTALRVKLADVADNLDGPEEPWHLSLRPRYDAALYRMLKELRDRTLDSLAREGVA